MINYIKSRPSSTWNDYTHMSLDKGFWCLNEENTVDCVDYKVSFCCPTSQVEYIILIYEVRFKFNIRKALVISTVIPGSNG